MSKLTRLKAVITSLPGDTHKERVLACAALSGRSVSMIETWLTKPPAPDVPDMMLRYLESLETSE
jgi:hypothetical protein